MKSSHSLLRASIMAASIAAPAWSFASIAGATDALAGFSTAEAPRVTHAVNNRIISTLARTRPALLAGLVHTGVVPDATTMRHLQLVLRPSVQRMAALQSLISGQHDPNSPHFHQWITPERYGKTFGISDSDIAAVKSWLVAQGFAINNVYPNKTEIDFSGNVGQIKQAFHTQEAIYTIDGRKHISNMSDISVPTALQPVVAGVMGLNDLRPLPQHVTPKTVTWNASTHEFNLKSVGKASLRQANPMAVSFQGGIRGLVPNDMAKMYGVLPIRQNGVTGKGITIAVVEDDSMVPGDWTNFVQQFKLDSYGGSFSQMQPEPANGPANCYDPNAVYGPGQDYTETLLDAEYATAMAPGANIVVASCSDYDSSFQYATDNFFGGVFIAADNLINAPSGRPDIISTSYGYGESQVDSASKTAIDLMWAQADAEGISVFVSSGDSGSNPSFNGGVISGAGVDANAFATSPNVTAVGGTDTADVLDGTTDKYFSPTYVNDAYGTVLGYVPEIPWNESCGNGVAAKASGFSSAVDFCNSMLEWDLDGHYMSSQAGSGGPSSVDRKPAWQRLITGTAPDQSRDVPDVSLFAGSFGGYTWAVICTATYPCAPNFTTPVSVEGGTSLAAPMMAGLQALIDQGIAMRGLPADQGNAAPTLYALAGQEYGVGSGTPPTSLAACNADIGTNDNGCVFHNVTRGSISTECYQEKPYLVTSGCYFFSTVYQGEVQVGLTTRDIAPTQYSPKNKAYGAQPGWSFASGLGSVNTKNLLIAWRKFVHAPAAVAPSP